MKFFKNIILSVAVAMFASCETDVETVQISNPDDFVIPVLKGEYSDITVTAENAKTGSVEFKWSAADFGLPTEVLYSVYLSCGDKSALLGQNRGTDATFSYEDINNVALAGLGIAPNTTGSVAAYVTAKIAGTDNYEPIVSAKSKSFNITTYEVPVKAMYLVGEINDWKEAAGLALEIWETEGGSNTYEGIYNFINKSNADDPDCGFQILPTAGTWNGQMGYDYFETRSECITKDGGNMAVQAGIYKLTANISAKLIKMTQFTSVSITGAFNGWSSDDAMMTYNVSENVWETEPVNFEAGKEEFLIRLNKNFDLKYGSNGKNSTVIPDGIELVESGGNNIAVPAAGTYVVQFYANRTPCVVKLIKQD
mgnify:CR=1 FL=1